MFNLTIENQACQTINLTNDRNCAVIGIDGLTPPSANILTSRISMNDGTRFNGAVVNQRNVVPLPRIQCDAVQAPDPDLYLHLPQHPDPYPYVHK